MNLKQNLKIFFGISIMLIFALSGMLITRDIKDSLLIQNFGVGLLPGFKSIEFLVIILLSIGAYFLTRKGKINRAFHLLFPINILFSLFMLVLMYFKVISLDQSSVLATSIFNKIVVSIFYLWVGFSNIFTIVLIWGYANQHYTFKKAAYQYPLIGLITFFPVNMYIYYLQRFIFEKKLFYQIFLVSAIIYAIIYIIYIILREVSLKKKDILKKPSFNYLLALIVIVVVFSFAKSLPQMPFKYFLKLKAPQASDYLMIMGSFSVKQAIYSIITFFIGILLGLWMYIKGSKILAKIGGFLIIVITTLGLLVFKMPAKVATIDIKSAHSLMSYGMFVSFSFLFLYLIKELCYFRFPLKNRFSAKILVDMIFLFLTKPLYGSISAFVIVKKGSILAANSIFMYIFFFSMLISFVALYWINKEQKEYLIE